MGRRRFVILVLGSAVVVMAVLLAWPGEREPEYKGRTLTEWLFSYEDSPADGRPLREALQGIGTNALPWLLRWAQYQPNPVSRKVRLIARMEDRALDRRAAAWLCFRILGPQASPAIPELARLANDTNSEFIAVDATLALGDIGAPALPALLAVLTNRQAATRGQAATSIGAMRGLGTNVNSAVPVLLRCLGDEDEQVAWDAANSLGRLQARPDLVVPVLAQSLQNTNEVLRAAAARALGQFGGRARPAASALIRLLSDPSPAVRERATNALRQIAPEVLP